MKKEDQFSPQKVTEQATPFAQNWFAYLVIFLRNSNERVRAIRLARTAFNVSLAEAAEWIDSVKMIHGPIEQTASHWPETVTNEFKSVQGSAMHAGLAPSDDLSPKSDLPAAVKEVIKAAHAIQDRLDHHFGGRDYSSDWKEQAELRAALAALGEHEKE